MDPETIRTLIVVAVAVAMGLFYLIKLFFLVPWPNKKELRKEKRDNAAMHAFLQQYIGRINEGKIAEANDNPFYLLPIARETDNAFFRANPHLRGNTNVSAIEQLKVLIRSRR